MTDLKILRQHELLSQLLRLACEQGEALQGDRLEDFLTLMEEREMIARELEMLVHAETPENLVLFPTVSRAGSEADIKAAVSALIVSVLAQDEENERVLRQQMDSLVDLRGLIGKGYAAMRGYSAGAINEPAGARLNVAR
jgi:hypothetical protein